MPCTCNPLQQGRIPPRGRRSREPTTFATLKTGSRAAATREPCQVRKEAALSGDRRVPRNGLVRAAGVGGRGSVLIDGGCTANSSFATPRPGAPLTAEIPHQALYRRWRAQTFSEIVGQEAVVATLRNAVATGRVSHAILFTGPRGTGKTSLARILAKALNCRTSRPNADPCDRCPSCVAIREGRALDLVEIDAASNRGIEAVRELRERLAYAPTDLRRKVYILDEAHQITRDAWNALLKSLEEPPEFVTFMFASTHPQEFPPAILSRLQRFDVRRLTVPEISGKLERILAADGREADPEAVALVARLAAGGMRDAESILDQLLSSTGGRVEAEAVRELLGLADAETVDAFVDGARRPATPRPGIALARRARGPRPGPARVPRPGRRRHPRPAARRARDRRPPTRPRWSPPPTGSAPSTRRAWARADCACSSSSPCSTRRWPPRRLPRREPARQPRRRARARRPRPGARAARRARARRASGRSRRDRRGSRPTPPTPGPGGHRRAAAPPRPRRRAGRRRPGAARPADPPAREPTAADARRRPPRPSPRRPPRPTPRTATSSDSAAAGREVVAAVSKSPPLKPLIESCRPIGVEGIGRDPRLPRGEGLPARGRRAQAGGHRGRDRGLPRPRRRRPLRRRATSTCCRRSPPTRTRSASSPRPSGSSPMTWPTSARSTDGSRPARARPSRIGETGAARATDHGAHRAGGTTSMGMGNLQRMAMQMQQEMARVQAELETLTVDGSAGGGVVKATVTGKQELVSVVDRSVGGRPRRRRDAPGPRRQRRQRGAARVAGARRREDGRGDRRPEDPGPRLTARA